MAKFEIVMPKLGESITEATITKWLKKPGDKIAEDEAIAEIATDKVDSEIPSPVEGTISEFLFEEGETVEIGKVIALISMEGEDTAEVAEDKASKTKKEDKKKFEKSVEITVSNGQPESDEAQALPAKGTSGRFYSPLVRNIAKEEGISLAELENIEGSGNDNRVTKDDILVYLKARKDKPAEKADSPGQAIKIEKSTHAPDVKPEKGDEVIGMSRLRKLIVQHMLASKDTSVHVTSVIEIDVTNLVNWRNKYKKVFEQREGEKLTFTPIFIQAIAKTLRDYPMINSSISGDNIILRKNINIGMAAAMPDGNLIVPVIKNADHKNLLGLAKSVNDLAIRARNNKLQPDEIQGGTFTITNLGTFDTIFGTPIINQPQVAILGTGAIKKKPVVLETELGDTIAIRSMMYLSMSYDHRIIDGALGGMALKRIGEYLQNWDVNQTI
ncbi:MAG: 2-oxo acid dehydrogenase subunit E2 [Bacteroidales bacterium]|nr:2-oxo acid dehydrogenase subunit E2 [Bacteroidales bacterium]